jgi:hypothetical protein
MQLATNPLLIELLPGDTDEIIQGENFQRRIRVRNLGDIKAEINIWLATDDAIGLKETDKLWRWCKFSEEIPLNVEKKGYRDVTLYFYVPEQATPQEYSYDILIEAPDQYPHQPPSRLHQKLRVKSSDSDNQIEPKFTTLPGSSSTKFLTLNAGGKLEVKVQVENPPSARTDSFYATCPDLPRDWYTVDYQEAIPSKMVANGIATNGVLGQEKDILELNPGVKGEISITFHPPKYTAAGNYFPTIRLVSKNHKSLMLVDVVYLQILPNNTLMLDVHPLFCKYPEERDQFDLELTNLGNVDRELKIQGRDLDGIFSYIPQDSIIFIPRGEKHRVPLTVKPQKWWLRHWRGKGLTFTFDILVEDNNQIIDREKKEILTRQGTLQWQSYPWQLFWLLVLLALLGLAGVGLAIWWKFFREKFPIPATPKVELFKPSEKQYQENQGITLDLDIRHPNQIEKITLIRLENNQETERKNFVLKDGYKDNKPVNPELKPVCSISQAEQDKTSNKDKNQENQDKILTCRKFQTNAKKTGNYTFRIEVFSKQNSEKVSSSQITDSITINSATIQPLPKIVDLQSSQPSYKETNVVLSTNNSLSKISDTLPIRLSWEISNPINIREIRLVGKTPEGSINSIEKRYNFNNKSIPSELALDCNLKGKLEVDSKTNLVCNNVPIVTANKVGDYIFTLTVIPQGGGEENAIIKQTPLIKINPLPNSQIDTFIPSQTSYQEIGKGSDTSKAKPPIRLNFDIANPTQIKELQIIGTVDGVLNETQRYPFSNGKPIGINGCQNIGEFLRCSNVITKATKPGNYIFKLVLVPKQGLPGTEIIKATEPIKIEALPKVEIPPTPVEIESFQINGQNAEPKYIIPINKQRFNGNINISWKVKSGEDIKVELQPVPGSVATEGSTNYKLSTPPNNETITLKVTNKTGQQVMRSVIIQTVDTSLSNSPSQPASSPGNLGRNDDKNQSNFNPSNRPTNELKKPLELPPKAD